MKFWLGWAAGDSPRQHLLGLDDGRQTAVFFAFLLDLHRRAWTAARMPQNSLKGITKRDTRGGQGSDPTDVWLDGAEGGIGRLGAGRGDAVEVDFLTFGRAVIPH
jgi:hypothetical protein